MILGFAANFTSKNHLDVSSLCNADIVEKVTLANAENTLETALLAGSLQLFAIYIFAFLDSAAQQ